MARFVLAGKADCPYYAKVELLADSLQRSLPDFKIRKISILPEEWEEWLEVTCKRNGWEHEHSPLIWRELVAPGEKALLLGGFSDFLEHCQNYYGITSDMPMDVMLSIAAENLDAKRNLIAEAQHRASLIKPLHIWISSALSPTCHLLLPNLVSADVFPHVAAISLHLLDLDGDEEGLQQLRMEMEDLQLPLLHQVTIHGDLEQAFREADVILLLDEGGRDSGDAEEENGAGNETRARLISGRYREYGRLIDTRANKEVKVIVSGDSFVNLRCSLLLENARAIDSRRFVGMATQLENEGRAAVARKLGVRTSDVTDVIVWGNISGSFHVDLQRAKVVNYDGPISGPAFLPQPVLQILPEWTWLQIDFQDVVRRRRAAVASETGRAAAMSHANGLLAVLKAWNGMCGPGEVFSLGVLCRGHRHLPEDAVLSVPVTFADGEWAMLSDAAVGDELREELQRFAGELGREKELGSENRGSGPETNKC